MRVEETAMEDAEIAIFAYGSVARSAKAVVKWARAQGVPVGMVRPITLWPFPLDLLKPLLPHLRRIVVVEASPGQLEDELRLALSHAGVGGVDIRQVRRMGGVLPSQREIAAGVRAALRGEEART